MTPSLRGRLQTRLFLFLIVGLPMTLVYALLAGGAPLETGMLGMLMALLVTVFAIGLLLDPVYIVLQRLRWDRDWPFAFQLFFSWVEFGLALLASGAGLVPLVPAAPEAPLAWMMVGHFAAVFVPGFLLLLGPLQVLSLRWRYNAGEFGALK